MRTEIPSMSCNVIRYFFITNSSRGRFSIPSYNLEICISLIRLLNFCEKKHPYPLAAVKLARNRKLEVNFFFVAKSDSLCNAVSFGLIHSPILLIKLLHIKSFSIIISKSFTFECAKLSA